MPMHGPPASRRWSRSARACGSTSAGLAKPSLAVSPFATTTDRNTCPTPSRTRSPSSASRVPLRGLSIGSANGTFAPPPAFVRAPEGNGCAERFIRTLKENLLWLRTFDTVEELRQALLDFRETYNTTWLIERHGFITPAAFRQQQLQPAAIAA